MRISVRTTAIVLALLTAGHVVLAGQQRSGEFNGTLKVTLWKGLLKG